MRFASFVAALIAALFLMPTFPAQSQVASQGTCQALLDGGGSEVCGTFFTNYQPFTATCEVSVPAASSAVTTVNLLASGDGTHYGVIADAGYSWLVVANGGVSGATTTVAFNVSPTNPWLDYEITASGTLIDGGVGGPGALVCQTSVINAQTLHSVRPTRK